MFKATNESCNQYITQPIEIDDIDYPFVGDFLPKGIIKLAAYNTTEIEFYKLGYSRKSRNLIAQTILSYIGLPSSYRPDLYIESNMQSVPMESLHKTNIILRISPRSFLLEEEQEQRHLTIISALGTIAAYYSSVAFIYVFLFGVDSITPWGVIHGCGCRKVKHRTREVIYEAVHSPELEANTPDTEIDLATLRQKVKDLEKFKRYIENNFVDTKLYEKSARMD
ncbi:349_t:CDS:2, partial [Ambispora leptoticha]